MSALRFHDLSVQRVSREAAGAVALTFAIPPEQREAFRFEPGQFITLSAVIGGEEVRRPYSISSPRSRLDRHGELEVGIRPVAGGVFSNWAATQVRPGDVLAVMPPDGRFTVHKPRALHRVGFAAGSGITPILSIAATTLEEQPHSKFSLVYGNRRMASVMFNEALQDLKDRYADRFTMVHILSRQAQEVDLLQGRIDGDKVRALVATLLPAASMDEVFICGPEAMMAATEAALREVGVPEGRIRTERFTTRAAQAAKVQADVDAQARPQPASAPSKLVLLRVLLDGKLHEVAAREGEFLLDAALNAGLDLPYSCKGGVCSTCRCKVLEGDVRMDKNFTLEAHEVAKGFVLSCQAQALTPQVVLTYDER
jgi:ring-1,2-phenylacetyl-CoA epoxidase subunit PaaE